MAGAFDRPTDFAFRGPDLRVALWSTGGYDWDWSTIKGDLGRRLYVPRVAMGCNEHTPEATIQVNTAGDWLAAEQLDPQLDIGDLPDLLHPDTRLVIYAEIPHELPGGGSDSRRFIFEGYPRSAQLVWTGDAYGITYTCTSLLDRLATESQCWIYGRWYAVPSASNPDTLNPQLVESDPCIFNRDGLPNRGSTLYNVNGVNTYLFTYDGDPGGKYWRYGDVLTYLLAHYMYVLGEEYPLQDGNGAELCATVVDYTAGDPGGVPDAEDVESMTFVQAMNCKADEITLEGRSLRDAFCLFARTGGFKFAQFTFNDGNGKPESKILWWFSGEGGPFKLINTGDLDNRSLRHRGSVGNEPHEADDPAPSRVLRLAKYGSRPTSGKESLVENEVSQGNLLFDASGVLTSVAVLGAPVRYEVLVGRGTDGQINRKNQFKPGWKPDATFGDDVAAENVDAFVADIKQLADTREESSLTGTPLTLFRRYVTGGTLHESYRDIGRVWVLNESGEYDGDTYGRSNAGAVAWEAGAYALPFDWAMDPPKCPLNTGNLPWAVRRRKMERPISRSVSGAQITPLIYASWDSGTTWHEYPGNVRVLEDQCGIYLSDVNLASVMSPLDGTISVWEAIVRATFRVAALFSVRGDDRVLAESRPVPAYATQAHAAVIHVHDQMRYEASVNSPLKDNAAYTLTELSEADRAKQLANRVAAIASARVISGTLISPWLRNDWFPGDVCRGIWPRGVSFAIRRNDATRYPQVVAVQWVNSPNNQATHITLEDERLAIRDTDVTGGSVAVRSAGNGGSGGLRATVNRWSRRA